MLFGVNKKIETKRLILRTVKKTDDKDMFEYSCEENVGPNAGWKPHESIEETREIMKDMFVDNKNIFAIVLKENKKLIGTIGFVEDEKNADTMMLGYAMGEKYWGKGYMTEAAKAVINYGFEEMKLEKITAYCYTDNKKSRKILEKCGFKYIGRLEKCEEYYDGTLVDNECFVLEK